MRHRTMMKACVLAAVVLTALPTVAAHAQQETSEEPAPDFGFSGTVTTAGIRQRVVMPSFLAVGDTITDLGVPVAQAVLNTGGVSEAFASNPYPGELVITGGDLVGGATGMPNQLPPYPAFVKASYPNQPEAAMSQPGFSLAALASPRQARGDGVIELSPDPSVLEAGKSVGSADVKVAGGQVEAEGVSVLKNVDIGGVLTIGELRSELLGTLDSTGKPKWSSKLAIEGATIAGTAVVLTPNGLAVADQKFSTAQGSADPLLELLREQGIELRVVEAGPEEGDETTMASRALQVIVRVAGTAATPATEFHFVLGAITGRLTAGSPGSFGSLPDDVGSSAPTEPPSPGPAGQAGADGSAVGSAVPSLGLPTTSDGGTPTAGSDSTQESAAGASGDTAPVSRTQAALIARDLTSEVQLPYILLAFGGFTIVACVTSWRRWIAPTVSRSILW